MGAHQGGVLGERGVGLGRVDLLEALEDLDAAVVALGEDVEGPMVERESRHRGKRATERKHGVSIVQILSFGGPSAWRYGRLALNSFHPSQRVAAPGVPPQPTRQRVGYYQDEKPTNQYDLEPIGRGRHA